jgi:hypothetical protein
MRLFRFLEAYQGGWNLYLSENKSIETWLDIVSKTTMGMFGMLESITIPDLLAVDHLEVFGAKRAAKLNLDAQQFWFVALYTSVLSTAIKLVRILAYRPVPPTGGGYGTGEKAAEKSDAIEGSAEAADDDSTTEEKLQRERKRLKEIVEKRRADRKARTADVAEQISALGLKILADILDIVIPASATGWIQVEPGLVGTAMFLSTIITGMQVWKRCRLELQRREA